MFDTDYTDNIICPHCGHEDRDSWEVDFDGIEGDTEIECGSCGKEFSISKMVKFYYTSRKITAGKDE